MQKDSITPLQAITAAARKPLLSPLRYPGGKRRIAPLIWDAVASNGGPPDLVIEPFAGGAAVSLAFLEAGLARSVAISDADPLVGDFWSTVFSADAQHLAELVAAAEVTLDTWRRVRSEPPADRVRRAFACLFLNRTSFSGSLSTNAGPIGGQKQESKWKIDCRYNGAALAARILQLSEMRDRVDFAGIRTWNEAADWARQMPIKDILWYLDPPYFDKAKDLYRLHFAASDHADLRDALERLPGRYILSYDSHPDAEAFYASHPGYRTFSIKHTSNIARDQTRPVRSEILVLGPAQTLATAA